MAKSIMIQGAGSNVGKSLIVAGLCRAYVRRGLKVRPFKPQNMSNNAAVTEDGGEIGRAQALQARACHAAPITDMNPVLLKPETDIGAQVLVQGKRLTTVKARDYAKLKPNLMTAVLESFHRLAAPVDLVIVEGAGSPAEVNLRDGDIANMGFASAAKVPVILAGDIDRGGVIAQLVGTHVILPPQDRDLIKGFMVNKFRGDVSLFDGGRSEIKTRTGWFDCGVLPWFPNAHHLPAEDANDIRTDATVSQYKIVVPRLSRMANFDDLDPLTAEPNVTVEMVEPGQPLPADADLVLLLGSKSTIGEMKFVREQGWDIDIHAHARRGGRVMGICGGYQMLGQWIDDPDGIEGAKGRYDGLCLLDVTTTMVPEKQVTAVEGKDIASGAPVNGYEIHIGRTQGPDCERAWLRFDGDEGAMDAQGRVIGTYVHGLFASDAFRKAFLTRINARPSDLAFEPRVDMALDALADHVERHLDLDQILGLSAEI